MGPMPYARGAFESEETLLLRVKNTLPRLCVLLLLLTLDHGPSGGAATIRTPELPCVPGAPGGG